MSVWIPEIAMAISVGDVIGVLAVLIQLGAFILSVVAALAGWWGGFVVVIGALQLYGPGFIINLVGALVGFAISMANLGVHGCLG